MRTFCPPLSERKSVRVNLTWVKKICQRIDHRYRAEFCQIDHVLMVKRTHDQTMHETRKDFGGIANRFTATELDIVFIEKPWVATEFITADVKRNPHARTRLG